MEDEVWDFEDAKAHLSDLIESATTQGPQVILNPNGQNVVVESATASKPTAQWPSLVQILRDSPLVGLQIPHTDRPERDSPFMNDDWEEDSDDQ